MPDARSGHFPFVALAEALVKRLGPVLPLGLTLAVASRSEVDTIRGRDPAFHHEMGVLVVSFESKPARVIQLGPYFAEPPATFDADRVRIALSDIADEAGEGSSDRYEGDGALVGDDVRIWFGVVPSGSGDHRRWREVAPELSPIPISRLSG
jgi:hypothetical protein